MVAATAGKRAKIVAVRIVSGGVEVVHKQAGSPALRDLLHTGAPASRASESRSLREMETVLCLAEL